MMGSSAALRIFPSAVLIVISLAVATFLTGVLEQRRPQLPPGLADTDLDLHGSRLEGFAFGMEGLLADWYYMRSLQYIGHKLLDNKGAEINLDDLRALNPRLLYPLLENATDLDPRFLAAYEYGAMVLPSIDAEKAIALTRKGIENNSDKWRLYQHLGYVYWRLERYGEAAEAYERGAAVAGAPPIMRLMASNMRSDGTSRETFRTVYSEMLASSTDERVREMAERKLRELNTAEDSEAIDRVLDEFKTRNGRCANNLREVSAMLFAAPRPAGRPLRIDAANRLVDPSGKPYAIDRQTCKVKTDQP
jgi:tetratricopeptide (TPR) repeat protein